MLRIRLSRVGKRKQPSYRLVVADSRAPRDGAFIKIIGHYNPRTEPTTLVVKEDEAVEWLRRGAQPSDTAAKLLTRIGVMERAGRDPVVWDRKTPVKPKKAAEEAPAATVATAPKETPTKAEASEETAAEPEAPVEEGAPEAEASEEAPAEPEAPVEEGAPEAEASGEAAAEPEAAAAEEPEPETEPEATKRPKAKPKKTAKPRSDP